MAVGRFEKTKKQKGAKYPKKYIKSILTRFYQVLTKYYVFFKKINTLENDFTMPANILCLESACV